MARGSAEKTEVINTILNTFQGSFQVDKEIRIPFQNEDGSILQIKVVCTAATKNIDSPYGEGGLTVAGTSEQPTQSNFAQVTKGSTATEPSPEEIAKVDEFLRKMGIS